MGHGGLKWKGKADCHALYEVILGHPGSVSLSLSVFPLPLPFPSCPSPSFPEPSHSWDAVPRLVALAGPVADPLATQGCTWLGISLELGIKVTGLRDC